VHALVANDDDARARIAGDARHEDDAVDGDQRHGLGRAAVAPAQTLLEERGDVERRRLRRVDARRAVPLVRTSRRRRSHVN